jgi:hypothetical protein
MGYALGSGKPRKLLGRPEILDGDWGVLDTDMRATGE